MDEIRKVYEQYPFYGYRKIHQALLKKNFKHNIKKTQRLMSLTGLCSTAPYKKVNTSKPNKQHQIHKYLLKDLVIDRPNQVWATDITYIKIRGGWIYLACIIDVFSRKIMGAALSPYIDTELCKKAFDRARKHGKPDIMNSDQGCQFTSASWIDYLLTSEIQISMDGKGRWADNVIIERLWRTIKYEALIFYSLEDLASVEAIIEDFIAFYNEERFHQALKYKTPDEVYFQAIKVPEEFDYLAMLVNSKFTVNQVRSRGASMGV